MVSRRPRMPRVPGAERARAEAAEAEQAKAAAEARAAADDAVRRRAAETTEDLAAEHSAADGETAKENATSAGERSTGGDVVELRRAADAAETSVGEGAADIVAEREVKDSAEHPGRNGEDPEKDGETAGGTDAPASTASSRIATEPGPSVSRLRPAGGSRGAGSASDPRPSARSHTAGARPAGSPQRRLGPGRTPEQAAQDVARRRQPAPKPVPARSVTGRSLVVIAVIFIAATLMAPTLRVYLNQSLEIAAAEQDIEDQQRQKAEYEERIARWEDPDFVRQQARDRLDLVMPGETLYMVTGQDRIEEVPEETDDAQEEPVNEHLPWAEGLWDSVVRAATE
ncbi:septum formation initiator family protein [Micrococcus lylae]|uniref:FtsB family cell division protein n=1 Tax=Micrococcus lylae TaxID=1273 RepID=UPI0021A8C2E7|nr:septum formation initiator family protein [Micrococcus lylae]MCT2006334.1 septum formation initiator family protein [Micrococcus lylae]MCT2070287.1 septum formation initiator family protein [Micrococcus lylae]